MKKIITSLAIAILLLPFVVKADLLVVKFSGTKKVAVGGYYQLTAVQDGYSQEIKEMVLKYDKDYLSIKKEDIVVYFKGDEVTSKVKITIEEGSISIKTEEKFPENPSPAIGDDGTTTVILPFKALKEGSTKINFQGASYICGGGPCNQDYEVKIEKNDIIECPTTKEETKEPPKDERKDKDLLFYISLGANGVLLLTLIVVAAKKSKKKEVAPAVEPVSAPVPEVPQEPTPSEPTENNQDNQ